MGQSVERHPVLARAALVFICRYGAADGATVGLRFGIDSQAAEQLLAALAEDRLVCLRGGLAVASREGLEATALPLAVPRITPRSQRHTEAVAAVGAWLERLRGHRDQVLGERELRSPFLAGRWWERIGPRFPDGTLKRPDLVIRPASSQPLAVEVELSDKGATRLAAIFAAWRSCAAVAGVLYLAPPALARRLERGAAAAGAQQRVRVLRLAAKADLASLDGIGSDGACCPHPRPKQRRPA